LEEVPWLLAGVAAQAGGNGLAPES
jgi:hypothetical protein